MDLDRVSDPHLFNAVPHPGFNIFADANPDPDPGTQKKSRSGSLHKNADPDSGSETLDLDLSPKLDPVPDPSLFSRVLS